MQEISQTNGFGSPIYSCLEVIIDQNCTNIEEHDLWSLGVIFYEINNFTDRPFL